MLRSDWAGNLAIIRSRYHVGSARVETSGVLTLSFYSTITTFTGTFTNANNKGLGTGIVLAYTAN